jgi:hypothetical protein
MDKQVVSIVLLQYANITVIQIDKQVVINRLIAICGGNYKLNS